MTVLEKIKRCVSLVWDFQEIYGEEDIEDFCHYELSTYPQHDEIMEYFKHIEELEKENAELRNNGFTVSAMTEQQLKEALEKGERLEKENAELKAVERMALYSRMSDRLAKAKELLEKLLLVSCNSEVLNQYPNCSKVLQARVEAEQFLTEVRND